VGDGEVAAGSHWFEDVAAHARSAYLRYSFTKGTDQEVGFLVEALGLEPGMLVLDVGCGPGRHAHALARRGITVHGIDISQPFVDLAAAAGVPDTSFERMDARALTFDAEFDAAISLCQGAFGLIGGDDDGQVLAGMARSVRPGGLVCVSAFSAYFQMRFLEDFDTFRAVDGVNHELATVKDEAGVDAQFDLWTTCFTPRELRLMARAAGLTVRDVWSVTPGAYARNEPTTDLPEFLLVALRPE
jgi:ubiquinone/menaquinone biosynthesis C-methylase UbiE